MNPEGDLTDFFPFLIKTVIVIFLVIYFIFVFLLFRQTVLMNRAIKTKFAGCLNFLTIINLIGIIIAIILVIVV